MASGAITEPGEISTALDEFRRGLLPAQASPRPTDVSPIHERPKDGGERGDAGEHHKFRGVDEGHAGTRGPGDLR